VKAKKGVKSIDFSMKKPVPAIGIQVPDPGCLREILRFEFRCFPVEV
jgi:hypothetical protein